MHRNEERIWNLIARKLSGDASLEELQELELLLTENPNENYSMEILTDLWQSKTAKDHSIAENKYRELVLRMQQAGVDDGLFETDASISTNHKRKKSSRLIGWVAGLAILALSGIAAILLLQHDAAPPVAKQTKPATQEVKTQNGHKTNLVLPDGTKVWLNAGSTLTYDKQFNASVREVSLSGEAFFDVVKNTGKPFIIHAGDMQIRVLGTAFNVRCYPDEKNAETSLVRGSLEVSLSGNERKYLLKPNQKLTVAQSKDLKKTKKTDTNNKQDNPRFNSGIVLSSLSVLPQDNSIVETSWVNNKLVFRSETFEEVARKMERWYGVNITINGEKLKEKIFTGIFENETVEQALDAMRLVTPFSFTASANQIIITR